MSTEIMSAVKLGGLDAGVVSEGSGGNKERGRHTIKRRKLRYRYLRRIRNRKKVKGHYRNPLIVSESERIKRFVVWCNEVGLQLHHKISIGRQGSCAEIGVTALDDIEEGECLAIIPRSCLLNCENSCVRERVKRDKTICKSSTSSWVPLLIALAAEYSKNTSSYWHAYLSLVPNNTEGCVLPMMWEESERRRLLSGTGVDARVKRDMERIDHDFHSLVLPFMEANSALFRKNMMASLVYHKLVTFVMSYSFTDNEQGLLSRTMMVPFVDLLNHASNHHAELIFGEQVLKLMAVRKICKGEEIMNTYGNLSNAALLHVYGFTETCNPYNEALISSETVHDVFLSMTEDLSSQREKHWTKLNKDEMVCEEYCVNSEGKPEDDLLLLVKLLHSKQHNHQQIISQFEEHGLELDNLNSKEKLFLQRMVCSCLEQFPGRCELTVSCHPLALSMSTRENHAHRLSSGQQQCLQALHDKLLGRG